MNPLAQIPMLTLLADAAMWSDAAEDRELRMAVHDAMLKIHEPTAPRYAYLKAPESIWADLTQELRISAMVERAHALKARVSAWKAA